MDRLRVSLFSLVRDEQKIIAKLPNTGGAIIINEYWLSNGKSSGEILGDDIGIITLREYNSTYYEAILNIKLPIIKGVDKSLQIGFGIYPKFIDKQASTITYGSNILVYQIRLMLRLIYLVRIL